MNFTVLIQLILCLIVTAQAYQFPFIKHTHPKSDQKPTMATNGAANKGLNGERFPLC